MDNLQSPIICYHDENLQNSSEISIINKAVDYFEAKRTINKGMEDIVLKREKNKENI